MSRASIWGVMSCFRPGEETHEIVRLALGQLDRLIVVDDGSGDGFDEIFGALATEGAEVVRESENRGIGAALNAGCRRAFDEGAAEVITLDQDSRLPKNAVRTLHRVAEAASSAVEVGVVVPEYFADVRQTRAEIAPGVFAAANVIQSGMLIPRAVFERIGGFREDYFIDLVDTEYELRLRREGLAVLAAPGVRMGHQLGQQLERRMLGMRVRLPGIPSVVTVSTPFRYYYRVRNRIVLNRAYRGEAGTRLLRDSLFDVLHFVNVLALARPRRAMWAIMRAGRHAGRTGRMGRMPTSLMDDAHGIRWAARPTDESPLASSRGKTP